MASYSDIARCLFCDCDVMSSSYGLSCDIKLFISLTVLNFTKSLSLYTTLYSKSYLSLGRLCNFSLFVPRPRSSRYWTIDVLILFLRTYVIALFSFTYCMLSTILKNIKKRFNTSSNYYYTVYSSCNNSLTFMKTLAYNRTDYDFKLICDASTMMVEF